jgi:hypothetical protein
MRGVNGSLLVLVACGLLAAGCGSSSSSSSSAVSKCKDAAKSISDSNARKVAEDACSAAGTAEKSISSAVSTAGQSATNAVSTAAKSVQSSAKQACLSAAQNVPAGSARDQAVAGCNKIK